MSSNTRIQVLVRHSDPISQAGLKSVLGAYADLELMGAPAPAPATLAAELGQADVVIADLDQAMRLASAAEAEHRMPARRLIVVTTSDREVDIRNALKMNICGYVLLGCALEDFASAVREVHRGGRYLSNSVAQRLAASLGAEALTLRETEVLQTLVGGMGNKAIARKLDIGVGTVKSHLRMIFSKLGVESRTQAIAAAQRRGLLDAPRAKALDAPPRAPSRRLVGIGAAAQQHAC